MYLDATESFFRIFTSLNTFNNYETKKGRKFLEKLLDLFHAK